MGAAWCVAWMAFSSNTPDECRMMKMEERLFLKKFTVLLKEDSRGVTFLSYSLGHIHIVSSTMFMHIFPFFSALPLSPGRESSQTGRSMHI